MEKESPRGEEIEKDPPEEDILGEGEEEEGGGGEGEGEERAIPFPPDRSSTNPLGEGRMGPVGAGDVLVVRGLCCG